MRVKIGDAWHEVEPGKPIMLELTPHDRALMANMDPNAKVIAYFDDHDAMSEHQRRQWMHDRLKTWQVGNDPHADGDYSRCCGRDWCRCMQ